MFCLSSKLIGLQEEDRAASSEEDGVTRSPVPQKKRKRKGKAKQARPKPSMFQDLL